MREGFDGMTRVCRQLCYQGIAAWMYNFEVGNTFVVKVTFRSKVIVHRRLCCVKKLCYNNAPVGGRNDKPEVTD